MGRCQLDDTFPYMLPGWSAEKVGANYMMISHVSQWNVFGRETATDPGRGGQPPGSVMNSNPRIPVVVYNSPLPGLRLLYGL